MAVAKGDEVARAGPHAEEPKLKKITKTCEIGIDALHSVHQRRELTVAVEDKP